jgi:hypothetical protein
MVFIIIIIIIIFLDADGVDVQHKLKKYTIRGCWLDWSGLG